MLQRAPRMQQLAICRSAFSSRAESVLGACRGHSRPAAVTAATLRQASLEQLTSIIPHALDAGEERWKKRPRKADYGKIHARLPLIPCFAITQQIAITPQGHVSNSSQCAMCCSTTVCEYGLTHSHVRAALYSVATPHPHDMPPYQPHSQAMHRPLLLGPPAEPHPSAHTQPAVRCPTCPARRRARL